MGARLGPVTPLEELMRGLDDMVRAGKVLYVGFSDAPSWIVARANTLAEERGLTAFNGIQIPVQFGGEDTGERAPSHGQEP